METVLSRIDNNYKILKFSGTRTEFATLIENNPGILIFKFTADWCGPCKKIKEYSYEWYSGIFGICKGCDRWTSRVDYRGEFARVRDVFCDVYELQVLKQATRTTPHHTTRATSMFQ